MADEEILCNPPILDSTLFPVGSAVYDPNYNILPFLCQLMKVATNENIDSVLVEPKDYDYTRHVNFTGLTGIGDPRFSTGHILSASFINFLPRIIAQLEVRQSGGSQIIDNYICDSDGNTIKESQTIPLMSSVGTGGINLLGYDIPSGLNAEKLLTPITQDEVDIFVNDFIINQTNEDAEYFISYITSNYPTEYWNPTLHAFKFPPFFYISLENKNYNSDEYRNTIYLKYYDNAQDYVAKRLYDIGYIKTPSIDFMVSASFESDAVARCFLNPIPLYRNLVNNDPNYTYSFGLSASNLYTSKYTEQYSYIKNPPTTFVNSNGSLVATGLDLKNLVIPVDPRDTRQRSTTTL